MQNPVLESLPRVSPVPLASGRVAMKASLSLASLLLLSPWPLGYAKVAVEIKELRRNGRALGLLALDHCGEKVDREGRESGACEGGEAK